MIRPDFAENP